MGGDMPGNDPREKRVLVLAPTGRDAPLIADALRRHGVASTVGAREPDHCVCREMAAGAGLAVLAEEGLLPGGLARLVERCCSASNHPNGPTFALLILTGKGDAQLRQASGRFQALDPIGKRVTQLERPIRIRTLISAVRAALRGRERQYEVRDYLAERESLHAELRRRAEQLAQTDQRKDEFLATLAHELRNPLAPVRKRLTDFASLRGTTGSAAEQARSMMDRQVQQLVRLVDDLLDVSRITRGTVELKKERVALSSIVATAVETSRPLIEVARHDLSVTLPPETLELEADPTRLAQVLSNLLNNAAKYTEERGKIWLNAEPRGGRSDCARCGTGRAVGIAADMLPRIFDLLHASGWLRIDKAPQGGLGVEG